MGKIKKLIYNYLIKLKLVKNIIETRYLEKISWKMPSIGDHWHLNCLSILGIGKYYGIDLSTLLAGLDKFSFLRVEVIFWK